MNSYKLKIIGGFLICGIAFGVYLNAITNSFHWDDHFLINSNVHIRKLSNVPVFFKPGYVNLYEIGLGQRYRPLRSISFAIDYFLWKNDARGYHITNILLHVVATLCVYWLLSLMMPTSHPAFPIIGALIFAAHPVHTESVVYIKNRSDILCTIFYLISIGMFVKWGKGERNFKNIYYWLSLGSFVCALLSKEMALSLPLVAMGLVFFKVVGYESQGTKRWLYLLPYFGVILIYVLFRKFIMVSPVSSYPRGLVNHLFLVVNTVGEYIKLLFYPMILIPDRVISDKFNLMPLVWLVLFGVLLIFTYRLKTKAIAFWMFFILVTISPVSNIMYIAGRPFGEQRLYIPSVGMAGLFSSGFDYLSGKIVAARGLLLVLFLCFATSIIFIFSYRTILRNYDWADEITLWSNAVKISPTPRTRHNLAVALSDSGRYSDAIDELETMLKIHPDYVDAYNTRGYIYYRLGLYEKSIESYEKGLLLQPNNVEILNNLATVYGRIMNKTRAEELFKRAIKIAPWSWRVYHNYGVFLKQYGRKDEAIRAFHESISLNPYNIASYLDLAELITEKGDFAYARTLYKNVLQIEPTNSEALRHLQ